MQRGIDLADCYQSQSGMLALRGSLSISLESSGRAHCRAGNSGVAGVVLLQ